MSRLLSYLYNISKMEKAAFDKYNAFSTKAGNVVWGAAMQLAWNELREKFANKKPL